MKILQLTKKKNLGIKKNFQAIDASNKHNKYSGIKRLLSFQKDVASSPKYTCNNSVNEQLQIEIESLTKTALSKKYSGEYNSWKDAKYRCNKKGLGVFDPRFNVFSDFLLILGPKPGKDYTLDRTDHTNPEYSPENTRWASKKLQSLNQKSTRYLTDANTGEKLPLTLWADKLKISVDTIRSRLSRGWSDHQSLYGKSKSQIKTHKNYGVWATFCPQLDPERVEHKYQSGRILISEFPLKFESRESWLYRAVFIEHRVVEEELILAHNPGEDPPPDLHKRFLKGRKLLSSIKAQLSEWEIKIAHQNIEPNYEN